MANDVIPLTWGDLLLASILVALNGTLSFVLSLGMERAILVASLRTLVQLSLIGYVLVPVFRAKDPWLTALVALVMIGLASREPMRRVAGSYRGMGLDAFLAIGISASLVTAFGLRVVVQPVPWHDPTYLIPLLGMVLGNALTGISLGLDRFTEGIRKDIDQIESLLAGGATPWRAVLPTARRALATGLTPILNTMSVVGLVSLPGMMTGHILAGSDPRMAARYQVVIMFMVASTSALGTITAILLAFRSLLDADDQRMALERLAVIKSPPR